MSISKQQITDALAKVNDPSRNADLVQLNAIDNIAVCDEYIAVRLALPTESNPYRQEIRENVGKAIAELDGSPKQINIDFVEARQPTAQDEAKQANPLPEVKHVIAVGAGKGGVGKSTIAVNLAIGLARLGRTVGLLDGDIYGPSVPTLLGLADQQVTGTSELLNPIYVHGIKTMTIGKLVEADKALIWRGPMAHGAFRQLSLQTDWGELDYLIVDLPPGTGDVPLTLAQMLPLSGAVIVCTPQKVAQDDAVRAVKMFEQLGIGVLGVVENMSYFIGDDGKEYDIFGKGGAAEMAGQLDLPLLGTIPINTAIRANGDAGDPRKNFETDDSLAEELETMCRNVEQQLESAGSSRPSISIS